METITITVSPVGAIKVDAQGFSGSGCTAATRAIEEALGSGSRSIKTEYYAQEETTQQQVQRW